MRYGFSKLQVSYKAPVNDGGQPAKGENRRLFTGGKDATLEDISTFQALGVHEIVFDFRAASLHECLDGMGSFGEDIINARI